MVVPVHPTLISLVPLTAGIFILYRNKVLGTKMRDYYEREFGTYMGGVFLDSHRSLDEWGFDRGLVIFFGIMLLIAAWSFSFGPICTGSDAEGDYCSRLANSEPWTH